MIKSYVFTGTHSTGKTTVLDELDKLSLPFTYHKSITRKVSKDSKINTDAKTQDQVNIIKAIDEYYDNNTDDINLIYIKESTFFPKSWSFQMGVWI